MNILDSIMDPLLNMNPFLAILLISFLLSLLITIIYKLMTDQEMMKTLKKDLKDSQKKMKKLKNEPEKMMKVQKQSMEKNMKYMMHSMKPTLVTFIPIILIFGWLNANMAYEPINVGEEFEVTVDLKNKVYGKIEVIPPPVNNSIEYIETNKVKEIDSNTIHFKFRAQQQGEWEIGFVVNNESTYTANVMVHENDYVGPVYKKFDGDQVKEIDVGNDKKVVLDLFGLKLGWLATYIILSIVFSMSMRKLLRIH